MQPRYLSKLAKQFSKLEKLKHAQHKLVTALEVDSKLSVMSGKKNKISSTRQIVDQQFIELAQQQMIDTFKLPVIKTIFYVSESEYAEHTIPCDRSEEGWYIIQAPVSNAFTTAFMLGQTFNEFELGDVYLIHNQTDVAGDVQMLDVENELIYDRITFEGSRCSAEPEGMIYIPSVPNAGGFSSIVLELR